MKHAFLLAATLIGFSLGPAGLPAAAAPGQAAAAKKAASSARKPAPARKGGKQAARPRSRSASASPKERKSDASGGISTSRKQKKGLESQQAALQKQIGELQKDISAKQARQSEEASAAKSAQAALSRSNRKLEELSAAQKETQSEIANIRKQTGRVKTRLADTRRDLAANARIQYLYAKRKPWQTLVSGTAPSGINQGSAILSYLADRHQKRADRLKDTRDLLHTQEKQSVAEERTIAANAANEQASNQKLAAEKDLHQANTRELGRQIASTQQQVNELKRDQQRLSALIQQIDAAIAAQEKAEREAREKRRLEMKKRAEEERRRQIALARKKAEQERLSRQKPGKKGAPEKPAPEPKPEPIEEEPLPPVKAPAGSDFAKLRGRLPMPVAGTVAGRYGQSRGGIGKWQGLFIQAASGSPVHAIAAGRVVYAGNLRGFGNLIILDHGGGYLSVYAYNSSLLRSTGSQVASGDTIARVGSGASGDTPGLYFEIRYKGQTINPAGWVR